MEMTKLARAIRGAGGGGQPEQHTPIESPDSLHSTAFARVLDIVSEGPIVGLKNGLQSVFFNETPLQNADGTFNFVNVHVDQRLGTQDQDYIRGFESTANEIGVGTELEYGTPWVQSINNLALSGVRVRLSVPILSQQKDNGDLTGYRVDYAIDLQTDGGAFVELLKGAFSGKTTSKYERSHRIDLPAAAVGWNIRVRRLTPTATTASIQDKTYVESFTEVVDVKLRYPNTALFGIHIDAKQFQAIPGRAYHILGMEMKYPSNYNPTTRAYTGIWDGTFNFGWTNNPAWAFFMLATHSRCGLGEYVTEDMLDKWKLYEIAKYCDELVPDGYGGTEPRFTCNLFLQTQADAFKVMQDMASIFRGMGFWANSTINVSADMPSDPVYTYTNANVIDGRFTYAGSGRRDRHTVAIVQWNDLTQMGKAKFEYVEDKDGIARYGVRQTSIISFGCTSRGQAHRAGKWLLASELLETDSITWTVALEGTIAAPGQIVKIADAARAGKRMGGRVAAGTLNTVTLDKIPTGIVAGNTISVIMTDATIEQRTISDVDNANNKVTVSANFPSAPAKDAVWLIEQPSLEAQLARVMAVGEAPKGDDGGIRFALTGVTHRPDKFDYVDFNTKLDPPNISKLPSTFQKPVTGIVISHVHRAGEVITSMALDAKWTPSPGAKYYDVSWQHEHSGWSAPMRVKTASARLEHCFAGDYKVSVVAYNAKGWASTPALSDTYTLPDQLNKPGMVTALDDAVAASQAQADAAMAQIANLSADDKLSATEKKVVIKDYNAILAEKAGIDAQAAGYGNPAEKTTYDNAVAALTAYLGTLNAPVAWNVLTNYTTVDGTAFRQHFVDVYSARTALLQKIADVATFYNVGGRGQNLLWDEHSRFTNLVVPSMNKPATVTAVHDAAVSLTSAGGGSLKVTVNDPTGDSAGNYIYFGDANTDYNFRIDPGKKYIVSGWFRASVAGSTVSLAIKTDDGVYHPGPDLVIAAANTWVRKSCVIDLSAFTGMGAIFRINFNRDGSTVSHNIWVDETMVEEQYGAQTTPSAWVTGSAGRAAYAAQEAADAAQTAASDAAADAAAANAVLADITSDSKLTASEKKVLIKEYDQLIAEQAGIDTQATDWAIVTEKNTYDTAITNLNSYLATIPTWDDVTVSTTVVGTTFRSKFKAVFDARQALLNAIYQAAQNLSNNKLGPAGANLIPNPTFVYNDMNVPVSTNIGYQGGSWPSNAICDGWLVSYDYSRTAGQAAGVTNQLFRWTGAASKGITLQVGKPVALANGTLVASQVKTLKPVPVDGGAQYLFSFSATSAYNGTVPAGITNQIRGAIAWYEADGSSAGATTVVTMTRAGGSVVDAPVTAPATAAFCYVTLDAYVKNDTGAAWTHDSTIAVRANFSSVQLVKKMPNNLHLPNIMWMGNRAKVPTVISYSATAGVAGATGTISVAAFTVTSGSLTVSYNAMSVAISGAKGATVQYYLYFDDPDASGGSQTLVATTNGTSVYAAEGRVYVGDCLVTFPTSGSGSGGGGRDSCVTLDMFLDEETMVGEAEVGQIIDVLDLPISDIPFRRAIQGVRAAQAECVRIETDGGAILDLSADTPFDLLDRRTADARDMFGELVITDHGIERVVSVTPIGLQWVARLSVGGISFAAGRNPKHRIFSHNALKP